MACRSTVKGAAAAALIAEVSPHAAVEVMALDLGDLSSVRRFADSYHSAHDGVDLLINNAGVMAIPKMATTNGFETQFGTNHLGHFALTGLLLPGLLARPGARVVTVSSLVALIGRIHFDDLQGDAALSAAGWPMPSPNWPTCCSPSSWPAGSAWPSWTWSAWPPIPGYGCHQPADHQRRPPRQPPGHAGRRRRDPLIPVGQPGRPPAALCRHRGQACAAASTSGRAGSSVCAGRRRGCGRPAPGGTPRRPGGSGRFPSS